jgi:hypothetical protein
MNIKRMGIYDIVIIMKDMCSIGTSLTNQVYLRYVPEKILTWVNNKFKSANFIGCGSPGRSETWRFPHFSEVWVRDGG